MNRIYTISAVAAVASAFALQEVPSFRSTTRLIQVSVIATDKNGKAVTDLTKEDFQLFEDGRRQEVSVFVAERRKAPQPPPIATNEFSNQFTVTDAMRPGYALILVDWMNSGKAARITSQQEVLRLLKQIEMRDLVAICVLDRGLRVLHDFTSDRAELKRKISKTYVAMRDLPPDSATALSDADTLDLSADDLALSGMNRFLGARRILNTLAAFEQIAGYLGSAPGRKSLIWVTSGFPSAVGYDRKPTDDVEAWSRAMRTERRTFSQEMDRVVRRFNNADIAVYPVDARAACGWINLAAMLEVASRTGGRAYYNRNDIDIAMRDALDDAQANYMFGYYPTNSNHDGEYRNIRVKTRRPGVTLRFRRGYEAEGGKTRKIDPKVALQQVLSSPLDTTSLPLHAYAEKDQSKLNIRLKIDPTALSFRQDNGRRKGKASLFFAFRPEDANGAMKAEMQSDNLDLSEEQYQRLAQNGIYFRRQVTIPPAATSIRIVLRDEESGLMGSITVLLQAVH